MTDVLDPMTDAQAIIDIATDAAGPQPLGDDGRFQSVIVPAGGTHKVVSLDELEEPNLARPRRKKGTYLVHDAVTFAAYWLKHSLPESEIWADVTKTRLQAVINAHTGNEDAGHEDHRLVYDVQLTDAWKAWTATDNKLMEQEEFAELIETRGIDIVEPSSADMLEVAQSFYATTGVTFSATKRLQSGERRLEYKEVIDAKAGPEGHLEVPETFTLRLAPFEGTEPLLVVARFRFRITNGHLQIAYKLERPEEIIRAAFENVIVDVEAGTEAPVFRGIPR